MASFESRGSSTRAVVRLPGGGKKKATFDTLREARAWASAMEVKKQEDLHPTAGTNAKLFEIYLERVASKTDSAHWNTLRMNKFIRDPLASLRTDRTTTHDINGWIERALTRPSERTGKGLKPATVNRQLTLMSSAFTYAVDALNWASKNPCHGAARPEQWKPRKRALLTPEEIHAL